MAKVHQLPEELVARIAAGEVVERPASVLKELVENSLDAGASRVSVTIEGAGRTLLAVSDDGCGMSKDDATLALRRHATSKISSLEDLESIATFGFRGEALPSIAAVSRFTLVTRPEEADSAWEFAIEGGRIFREGPAARERGTSIDVRDLFFNTPARFKFLKSDGTERTQCLRVMEELFFASLGCTFELRLEKAKPVVFRGHGGESVEEKLDALRSRLLEAWGVRWSRGVLSVNARSDHFRVWGLATTPDHHQATPRMQFLYVNGRPVVNRRLTRAIYDGYVGQLPSLRHPGWVLFLEVDPRTVDVNVHPSKREVKLTHESEIFGFLMKAVKASLQGGSAPATEFFPSPAPAEPVWNAPLSAKSGAGASPLSAGESVRELYRPLPVQSPLPSFAPSSAPASPASPLGNAVALDQLVPLAQLRNTFIVAQSPDALVLVDQHAAAEKVLYERLLRSAASHEPATQMLLVPFPWETSLSVRAWVAENLPLFRRMGFVLEEFGGATFVVKGYPANLGEKFDLHSLLDGLTDLMGDANDKKGGFERDFTHRLAAMTACKAAVKAGDALELRECAQLLKDLAVLDHPMTCPHGRPTVLRFGFDDLERRFRRR